MAVGQGDGGRLRRSAVQEWKEKEGPWPAALSWAEQVIIKELEGLVAQLSALASTAQNPSSKGPPCPGVGQSWPTLFI